MTNDPEREMGRRDEVLEMLYWIEGEGFGGTATLDGIARFLTHSRDEVLRTVNALIERGDVTCDGTTGEYRLTDVGRIEASRRFAEDFAPMLGQGHGECNDPDCDCHSDPKSAAECHAAKGRPA